MQNEDISNKTITITTRSAEKTLRFLAKHGYGGFKKMQNCHNQKKLQGKQSYKNICKSGQGLSVVDIGNSDEIKLFHKAAQKYKMDFAVKRDKNNGKYVLFFKAKDKEIFDRVFLKYKDALEQKGQKKSLKIKLANKKIEAEKLNQKSNDMGKKLDKGVAI